MNHLTGIFLAATAALSPIAAAAQTETPQNREAALARIQADDAVLVLVDFTDGLYPIVDTIDTDELLNNAVGMGKIAKTFGVPIMVLGDEGGFYGAMHPAIKDFAGNGQPFERTTPSAWASGGLKAAIERTGRKTILIGGITTDNCTLLTSLDMLLDGYKVYVVSDISGADSEEAHDSALMRLRDAGAATTSWISIGSELLESWETPEGAQLQKIYGNHMNGPLTSPRGSTATISARSDSEQQR